MMPSVHKTISSQVLQRKKGQIIFPSDFRGVGTEAAIKMALSRLAKEKKLLRLGHGLYYLPKKHPALGYIQPSLEEIAEAIAIKDKVRIFPTGSYALNRLGLSTQVPMKQVYLTDGPRRSIKIGKTELKFKPTTPKKLSYKGPLSGLLITALEELGTENISAAMAEKISHLLSKEDPALLKHDMGLAPARIYDTLLSILKKNQHVPLAEIS